MVYGPIPYAIEQGIFRVLSGKNCQETGKHSKFKLNILDARGVSSTGSLDPRCMRRSFEFYFDFISPFGYLASLRVDDLATRHQRECRWQSMLLGISVLKVMGMQPITQIPLKGDYLRIDLERYLRRHKLTLARTRDTAPSNPIPAGRTFHWIDQYDQTLAKKVAKAILDAYWRQGEDIGSPETMIAIARARWRRRGWAATRLRQRRSRPLAARCCRPLAGAGGVRIAFLHRRQRTVLRLGEDETRGRVAQLRRLVIHDRQLTAARPAN
jgi:2-hydroxychromene-2-carboxylate isomerase